jgi:elongation factor Ts
MQIAARNPIYVAKEDVPAEIIEHEKSVLLAQALAEGKPAAVVERMVTGRLEKYYSDVCLLEQLFIRDQEKTARKMGDLVREMIAKFGENIQVKRFARMALGE